MKLEWMICNLRLLSKWQFSEKGNDILWSGAIRFAPMAEALSSRERAIYAPIDIEAPLVPAACWTAPFSDGRVTLWNPIERPGDDWVAVPNPDSPVFWRKGDRGPWLVAWNFFSTLLDLYSFREDRDIVARDEHDRFPIEASPRYAEGLTQVPFANEGLALLLAGALAVRSGDAFRSALSEDLLSTPWLALSHDCDALHGSDRYSQAIRAYRGFSPVLSGQPPKFAPLRGILENTLTPRRYYFDNMFGMFDVERQFGMRSVSYILNGKGGRFGARTPMRVNEQFIRAVPQGWPLGLHYNYGTMHDPFELAAQKRQAEVWTGSPIDCGRAHYLKFDPLTDFHTLAKNGFLFDESVGWPYEGSYRCGVAGPFRPWDTRKQAPSEIVELPLTIMDATLSLKDTGSSSYLSLYRHLCRVGGILTLVVHPGAFFNPEREHMTGVYHTLLRDHYQSGGTSVLPADILEASRVVWRSAETEIDM